MRHAAAQDATAHASVRPLGIIAGEGWLPVLLVREMYGARPLIVVSIAKEPHPDLERFADRFHQIGVGRIHGILRAFGRDRAEELVILGGVSKGAVFRPHQLDWLALKILARTRTRGDQALFRAIADEFSARGFSIADQRAYLPPLVPQAGLLTTRKPTRSQRKDALYALDLARHVAALDIGQTVAVKGGVPLAIEAFEGTNEMIRRAGALAGDGIVVAKACHPEHDFRFDVPTVGIETLNVLNEVRAGALVIEAGRTFVLDRERFASEADACGIAVIARE